MNDDRTLPLFTVCTPERRLGERGRGVTEVRCRREEEEEEGGGGGRRRREGGREGGGGGREGREKGKGKERDISTESSMNEF